MTRLKKMMKTIREQLATFNIKLFHEPRYVAVFRTKETHLISLYKLLLEEQDIPVVVFNQRDSSYNAFGDISLNVPRQFEEAAKKIIREHE